ncbi:CHRD domain-containing protein, partial [Mesorhizobium sp. M4A.F.Ca.ET.050.02.1.1]
MRIQPLTPMFSALAISASILLAFPALAETVKYTATLDGGQQSPPVTTQG